MTAIYEQQEQNIQQRAIWVTLVQALIPQDPEKFGAAISTSFATVTMTAFLWSQIVSSLIQQTV